MTAPTDIDALAGALACFHLPLQAWVSSGKVVDADGELVCDVEYPVEADAIARVLNAAPALLAELRALRELRDAARVQRERLVEWRSTKADGFQDTAAGLWSDYLADGLAIDAALAKVPR